MAGVSDVQYPDSFWWSSKQRFASVDSSGNYAPATNGGARTSEILEIDLGRVREFNYINFDVIRAPIDITIEYDAVSVPDREPVWLPVTRIGDLPFDTSISFDANNRTSWLNGEYNFADSKGNMIHARYLRITFTRRDEPWPTSTSGPFAWPVFVKHLRIGRYVATLIDTAGPLLNQDTPNGLVEYDLALLSPTETREVRQQFVIPATSVRAGVTPNILGFGILIQTTAAATPLDQSLTDLEVSFGWNLHDVTAPTAPVLLRSGVETGAVTNGMSWLDFYLDDANIIAGDTTKVYELRVESLNPTACSIVFTHAPNSLSNTSIPGTLTFTNNSTSISTSQDVTSTISVGDYIVRTDVPDQPLLVNTVTTTTITINTPYPGTSGTYTGAILYPFTYYSGTTYVQDASKALVMRVWADITDTGKDVLGNAYRYVTRRQKSSYVLDGTKAGWMSQPVPTPDAVEALYFDVRTTDATTNDPALNLIEAIRIAPRTPGVRMTVYYSQQGLTGERPVTTNEWDYLLWTPIHEVYTLRRDEVIQLPQAIRASFIKLEFTALRPLPYNLPTFPPLPPRLYRRYPTWIEDQFNNAQVRNLVDDWFLRTATPVETNVLQSLANPILEFEYKQREFLGALALGQITDAQIVNSGIVDIAGRTIIDPTTASKIFISTSDQFQNTPLLSVDQDSILGQVVIQRFDPTLLTDPIEQRATPVYASSIPMVSTTNDRVSESYQNLAQVPMRFNKTCRHEYTVEQAEFNKKAYFVGIEKVAFLRNNYIVKHDDAMVSDILHDDVMLTSDTFMREEETTIPSGTTVYVSYQVGETTVTDEAVFLSAFSAEPLSVTGEPARNLLVYSAQNKQGIQYFQGQDYQLGYSTGPSGERISYVERSSLSNRLSVPLQPIIYIDAGTVIGVAVIPNPPTDDAAVVTGVAVISGVEGPFVPDYGAGTYGGGTYGNLTKDVADSGTVIGVGIESGVTGDTSVDAGTVTGVAVISATGSYNGVGPNP